MFGFFNLRSKFEVLRQVGFIALLLVFAGFLSGAVYSNMVSLDKYNSYTTVMQKGIDAAKNGEWTKELMPDMHSDTVNLIFIFISSFFVFGKPFSAFFSFKSGFLAGFFISFFVKVYGMKGLGVGMYLLLDKLVFVFPATVLLTGYSFRINNCITDSVFDKCTGSMKKSIKQLFFPFFFVFLFAYISTVFGNYVNFLIIPRILSSVF